MWIDFFAALGLMLVFEGILPFLRPSSFREKLAQAAALEDGVFRMIGLASMLAGAIIVAVVRA